MPTSPFPTTLGNAQCYWNFEFKRQRAEYNLAGALERLAQARTLTPPEPALVSQLESKVDAYTAHATALHACSAAIGTYLRLLRIPIPPVQADPEFPVVQVPPPG